MRKIFFTFLCLMSFLAASAQWSPTTDLQVTKQNILGFEAKTNKDGVTFVAFQELVNEDPEKQGDRYSDGFDIAYNLQIIDAEGNKLFPNAGILISHEPSRSFTMGDDNNLLIDNDGNALVIVKDERNWNSSSYPNQSYFIYKVSPAGLPLWETPVDLDRGYAYFMVANIKAIQLADGSYILAHDIRVSESKAYIAIDRISKDGDFIWSQPLLLTDNTIAYSYPYLTDAGNGQFIMVYAKSPGNQMYARKYDFEGSSMWTNEVPIYRGGFPSGAFPHTAFEVISDQKGGVLAGWFDDRYNSNIEKVYVSHILSNGQQAFVFSGEEEGLRLSYNTGMRAFRPHMAYNPANDFLYTMWEETNSNQNFRSLVFQKITKEGELLWTNPDGEEYNTAGLVLDSAWTPSAVGYHSIQLAGEGKIAVFWQSNSNLGTKNIAGLVDVTGEQPQFVWPDKYFVFSGNGSKSGLVSLPLFNNEYFLTFWHGGGSAAYAQKVSLSGPNAIQLPKADTSNGLIIIAKDGKIDFSINNLNANSANIEIYSVSGQRVLAVEKAVVPGENTLSCDAKGLYSGVYIARITTSNGVLTQRFIINK